MTNSTPRNGAPSIQETPECRAETFGGNTAAAEMAFGAGNPREAPLSGEWAGEVTPASLFVMVMERIAEPGPDFDLMDSLAESFEAGYFARWSTDDDA